MQGTVEKTIPITAEDTTRKIPKNIDEKINKVSKRKSKICH